MTALQPPSPPTRPSPFREPTPYRFRWDRISAVILWLAVLVLGLVALSRDGGPAMADAITLLMVQPLVLGFGLVVWSES